MKEIIFRPTSKELRIADDPVSHVLYFYMADGQIAIPYSGGGDLITDYTMSYDSDTTTLTGTITTTEAVGTTSVILGIPSIENYVVVESSYSVANNTAGITYLGKTTDKLGGIYGDMNVTFSGEFINGVFLGEENGTSYGGQYNTGNGYFVIVNNNVLNQLTIDNIVSICTDYKNLDIDSEIGSLASDVASLKTDKQDALVENATNAIEFTNGTTLDVKIDGTTIVKDPVNGTLSAVGGSGGDLPEYIVLLNTYANPSTTGSDGYVNVVMKGNLTTDDYRLAINFTDSTQTTNSGNYDSATDETEGKIQNINKKISSYAIAKYTVVEGQTQQIYAQTYVESVGNISELSDGAIVRNNTYISQVDDTHGRIAFDGAIKGKKNAVFYYMFIGSGQSYAGVYDSANNITVFNFGVTYEFEKPDINSIYISIREYISDNYYNYLYNDDKSNVDRLVAIRTLNTSTMTTFGDWYGPYFRGNDYICKISINSNVEFTSSSWTSDETGIIFNPFIRQRQISNPASTAVSVNDFFTGSYFVFGKTTQDPYQENLIFFTNLLSSETGYAIIGSAFAGRFNGNYKILIYRKGDKTNMGV